MLRNQMCQNTHNSLHQRCGFLHHEPETLEFIILTVDWSAVCDKDGSHVLS